MEIAEKIYHYILSGKGSHDLLNIINSSIKDKETLTKVYEYFLEKYENTPNELVSDKYKIEEIYAISSTVNYIREPNKRNKNTRDKFYKNIGYIGPI